MENEKVEIIKVEISGPETAIETNIRKFFSLMNKSDYFKEKWGARKILETEDGWRTECVESYGGGEGSGEERWVVIKVIDPVANETFWEIPGFYQSYHGSEFQIDETFRVIKKQKMIDYWEAA